TAVTLGAGSALRGFSVESSGTASALVSCAGGAVTLDTVLLAGAGVVTDGLDITSSCSATLQSVSIVDFAADSLNVSTSGTVAITGGLLSASQVGLVQTSGSVTASGLAVESNGQYGIRLPFNSNNPSLTITGQSLVENNGTTGDFAGIAVTKGTLSVTSTQLAGNGGAGIAIASAGAHTLANVQLTGNGTKGTEPGLWISSGTLTASGVSASGNSGDGVTASGGSSSFTGATLSSNKGNGLGCASSCTFDLSGGTIQNNTKAGISGGLTGTLTVHGGTEITGNATGVQLTGAVTTIAGANIHGNSGPGVSVDHNAGSTIGIGSPTTTTTIAGNQQQGIVVPAASPVPGSGANSLTIDSATITGNGSFGIYLQASDGTVAATVKANTITGNADTGLMVEEGVGQTTVVAVQNNDVSGNNVKTSPRNVGGVLFNTSARLTSFIGNKVHSNGGDELGFNGLPDGGGTKWTITPPSNACDTTANSIYCYGTGNVGIHVLAAGASVDAQHQHWTNNPPTVGIDYTGTVTVTNPCTAITTCP
ncbi:MAG TPA: right-handed parallel beta-helix repeat-containing protein, partial [Polyangia bacterium]|nr:right-handed parallel beta-helix repeat-containing protein [Polyangia bacterium]